MSSRKGKVHIINSTTYEQECDDGSIIITTADGFPPSPPPKGMAWHGVLGKFVPEDDLGKEMWVDEKEVFGDEECGELAEEKE